MKKLIIATAIIFSMANGFSQDSWSITTGNDTLIISTNGAMDNYGVGTTLWDAHKSTITTVIIQNSVTSIGDYAFEGCTGLTSVIIGSGVGSIGDFAFDGCSSIGKITFLGNNAPTGSSFAGVFDAGLTNCTLKVRTDAIANFQSNTLWNSDFVIEVGVYLINASENNSAYGTVSGGNGYYIENDIITLTATPNDSCELVNWTANNIQVSAANPFVFTATGDTNLVAVFKLKDYTINISVNLGDSGTVTGGGTYTHGDNVSAVATPKTGYEFTGWTINNVQVSTSDTFTFIATGDTTLLAHFSLETYNVNVTSGMGYVFGSGAFTYLDTVTIGAVAPAGYDFVNWTITPSNVVFSTINLYKFTTNTNLDLVANFTTKTYAISVSANPADSAKTTGSGIYRHNDPVTLTATADSGTGYKFISWTENNVVVSTTSTYVFAASANRTLVANFELGQCNIKVSSADTTKGGVSLDDTTYIYTYTDTNLAGDIVTVEAFPKQGYRFVKWTENTISGNTVSTDNPYIFTAKEDIVLVANFDKDTSYLIITSVNPLKQGGNVSGGGMKFHGDDVTAIATPNIGYKFINWTTLSGDTVSTVDTFNFIATTELVLFANFEIKTYTIAVSSNNTSYGNVSGSNTYNHFDTVNLVATPTSTTYRFAKWTQSGNTISTDSAFTFIAEENLTLVGHFDLNIEYTIDITVNPADSGRGIVSGNGTYYHGDNVNAIATPNKGYSFKHWTDGMGSFESNVNPYGFMATANRTLRAWFDKNTYMITVLADSGSVSGGGTKDYDDSVTVVATPRTGFHFVHWAINDSVVSTNDTFGFRVEDTQTLFAHFEPNTYNITVWANPVGIVIGGGTFTFRDIVTVKAVAVIGYHFDKWTINGTTVSTDTVYNFIATSTDTLIANFVINTYTIAVMTLSSDGDVSLDGVISGSDTYNHGDTVTVEATVITAGYRFVNWTASSIEVSTNSTYKFIATEDLTLQGHFNLDTFYFITVSTTDSGSVSGGGKYYHGDSATVIATPKIGYHFVDWERKEDNSFISNASTYRFEVIDSINLQANFAINNYTITVPTPTGGTVSGNTTYNHGDSVKLIATPTTPTYRFVKWTTKDSSIVVSTSDTLSFIATEDTTFVAHFNLDIIYTVATSHNGYGKTTGDSNYYYGDIVTVTAIPDKNYMFVRWEESGTTKSTDNPYSFEITAHRTLTAIFNPKEYKVTVSKSPNDGGIVTIVSGAPYSYGGNVTVRAISSAGKRFTHWTINDVKVSTNETYIFIAKDTIDNLAVITNDSINLVAHFNLDVKYNVTLSVNDPLFGSTSNDSSYYHQDTVRVTAYPKASYKFVNWTDNNGVEVSTANPYIFEALEDVSLVANFELIKYHVTVNSYPGASGYVSITGDGTYNHGESVTVTATPRINYEFTKWTLEDTNVVKSRNAAYTFTVTEDIVLYANFKVTPVNITDINIENSSLRIYPNPATTKLYVQFDEEKSSQYSISNVEGQVILSGTISGSSSIDVESLSNGMYYINISGKVLKFVKM